MNLSRVSYLWGLTTQLPTFKGKDGHPYSSFSYSHLTTLLIVVDEHAGEHFQALRPAGREQLMPLLGSPCCQRVLGTPH